MVSFELIEAVEFLMTEDSGRRVRLRVECSIVNRIFDLARVVAIGGLVMKQRLLVGQLNQSRSCGCHREPRGQIDSSRQGVFFFLDGLVKSVREICAQSI